MVNINIFLYVAAACVVYAIWQCLKQWQLHRIIKANPGYKPGTFKFSDTVKLRQMYGQKQNKNVKKA